MIFIILLASCVAVIGIIYYVKYQDDTIPHYDPYGKLSSPRPVINEPSVRGRYGNVDVTTLDYETDHIFNQKNKFSTTTEKESYTTIDVYSSETSTEQKYEKHDYSTEQYQTHIFNHKFHTTTEELESDEQDDYSPSTMTAQHHTTTQKSTDYEEIDEDDIPHEITKPFKEYNQESSDEYDSDSKSYYYDEIKKY